MPIWTDRWTRVKKMIMLITRRVMQKILKKQNEMIFLIIRTLTGTQEHIIYLNMKYGNHVENKGQTRSPSLCFMFHKKNTSYLFRCCMVGPNDNYHCWIWPVSQNITWKTYWRCLIHVYANFISFSRILCAFWCFYNDTSNSNCC